MASPESFAAWHIPISPVDLAVLTAPDVVPRSPYFLAILMMSVVVWWFIERHEAAPNELSKRRHDSPKCTLAVCLFGPAKRSSCPGASRRG
jgi:hypothetical protein